MDLEELDRVEAEARKLRADPFSSLHVNIRRSERQALGEYAAATGQDVSEALRGFLREGIIRWKRGGEHGSN